MDARTSVKQEADRKGRGVALGPGDEGVREGGGAACHLLEHDGGREIGGGSEGKHTRCGTSSKVLRQRGARPPVMGVTAVTTHKDGARRGGSARGADNGVGWVGGRLGGK